MATEPKIEMPENDLPGVIKLVVAVWLIRWRKDLIAGQHADNPQRRSAPSCRLCATLVGAWVAVSSIIWPAGDQTIQRSDIKLNLTTCEQLAKTLNQMYREKAITGVATCVQTQ